MNEVIFIAVCNEKGGVGKTTTVINLAQSLAADKKVVVIDGDKLAASRTWARSRPDGADFPVLSVIQGNTYMKPRDIVIFDTAGGIDDDEVKDLMTFCDFFILPTKTDALNFKPTLKMAKDFLAQNINFRVLINEAYGNYARANQLKEYFESEEIPVFDQMIPRSSKIVDAIDSGKTIKEISGVRAISDKYDAIAAQILSDISKKLNKRGQSNGK